MTRFLQLLILVACISFFGSEALAGTVIRFGTCEIEISPFADRGLTGISQTATVRDKSSGLTRKIGSYTLSNLVLNDFPVHGVDTLIIKEWTGGNHCCHWDYVITYERASKRQRFQILGSADGYAETKIPESLSYADNKPVLALLDDLDIQGMDWSPEWHLCYASSPYPTRIIVFDTETLLWKDVGPRNSRHYYDYDSEYAETIKGYNHTDPSDTEDRSMLALEAAYHIYMAGASKAKVDSVLYRLVPKKFLEGESNGIVRLTERIIQKANSFRAVEPWPPD
jgi:hypothetical protein